MNVIENEVWGELKRLAIAEAEREPALSGYLYDLVIRHRGYPDALAYLIATSLANPAFNVVAMSDLVGETIARNPEIVTASLYDLNAVCDRDPACESPLIPFLYYKGFKGLQAYRVAHALWKSGRRGVARFLQSRITDVFAMDIHPHATHRPRRIHRSRDRHRDRRDQRGRRRRFDAAVRDARRNRQGAAIAIRRSGAAS